MYLMGYIVCVMIDCNLTENYHELQHDFTFRNQLCSINSQKTLYSSTTKYEMLLWVYITLQWRHNDHDSISNHQPHGCLHNRLFRRRSKKTSKLRVTGLCAGNSPGPVNSPHKGPVARKMFPFDDVIMKWLFNQPSVCQTISGRHDDKGYPISHSLVSVAPFTKGV